MSVVDPGSKLIIASHNPGKVFEISRLLAGFAVKTVAAAKLGFAEPEETAASFIGNAELKARAAAGRTKHWVVSDDSGLEVEALGGKPGIHSARWARLGGGWEAALKRVHASMAQNPDGGDKARFVCAVSLARGDFLRSFCGEVRGRITWPPKIALNSMGFGYDPIFIPDGHRLTFAQMPLEEKEAISHRTAAFTALGELLPSKLSPIKNGGEK